MTRHIDRLGMLWVAFGLVLFATLVASGVFSLGLGLLDREAMLVMAPTAALMVGLGVVFAAGCSAVGIGLGRRLWWARGAALAAACMVVGSLPLGTALGVYSFVTLLDADVSAEFAQ